jgi:single-strand DNA-binding protein
MALITGIMRLGRDCELRYMPNGDAVANLALAFNYGAKDASGKRPAQWIEAAVFGKRAESLAQYLLKGVAIGVTIQDPHIETYTTKDGRQGSKLVGRVIDLEFAGGAKQEGSAPATPRPASTQAPAQAPSTGGGGSFADFDDDIPF